MHSRRDFVIAISDQSLASCQLPILLPQRLTEERQREDRRRDERNQTGQVTVPSFREIYATGICQAQIETQRPKEQRNRNCQKLERSLQHYV